MIREICKAEVFLAQKAEAATADDLNTAQDLLDTLIAHKDGCVGMAANMIGVNKRIIAFENDGEYMLMFNPVIVKKSGPYDTEEGCLSLTGTRKAKRFQTVKVQWQNEKIPNTPQDLHRLDGGDHPARDRPLRGDRHLDIRRCIMLKQLKYFQSVVRLGSFSAAAEENFISQSAISQQVQSLERELGFALLVRKNRSFSLTPAGEYFYRKSLLLTAACDRMCAEAAKIAKGEAANLKIGYLRTYAGG